MNKILFLIDPIKIDEINLFFLLLQLQVQFHFLKF